MDLSETPAVEPTDMGADDRIGYRIAGAILVFLGWVLAIAVNLLLHDLAPVGGTALGPVRIFHQMGSLAWGSVALGVFTGAIGVGLLLLGRVTPKGKFVLPGRPY